MSASKVLYPSAVLGWPRKMFWAASGAAVQHTATAAIHLTYWRCMTFLHLEKAVMRDHEV
jgi:hypothetical protein